MLSFWKDGSGQNYVMSVHLPNYFSGDQIEKNEIGGACSTYGVEESCIQCFGGET